MDWIIANWEVLSVVLVLVFDRVVIWWPIKHRDFIVTVLLWLVGLLKKTPSVTKTSLFLLVFLLIPVFVFAAPFLVCDPQTGVDKYILEINTVEMPELAAEPDGSIRYDLAGIAEGDFIIRAKAGNIWGWSTYSDPLSFTKTLPQTPMGLRVSSE